MARVLGVSLSLLKGWSPVKKLFALLFAAGLLSFAVGCPPASSPSTSHSGTTQIKSSGAGTGMPGGSHMSSGTTTHEGAGTSHEGSSTTHKETVTPPSDTKKGGETKKE